MTLPSSKPASPVSESECADVGNPLLIARLAAVAGFLGVGFGAFGAHGLASHLASTGGEAWWKTATFYLLLHAVAAWGAAVHRKRVVAILFLAGVLLFSGSLYVMALTGIRGLGAITPLGGVLLLAGWGGLVWKP